MTNPPELLTDEERYDLLNAGSEFDACWTSNAVEDARNGLLTLVEHIVRARMAEAWDQGYRCDWTGGVDFTNPYRDEEPTA